LITLPEDPSTMKYTNAVFQKDIFVGKVLFCTGGAGTICRGQVEAMVQLGANAVILGRRQTVLDDAAKEIQKLRSGSKVLAISADVRNFQALEKAAQITKKELGRIDFVICGAAGNFLADVKNLSANAFKSVIDIDLLGSYNTIKATLPYLIESKGDVLFVSATLHYNGIPYQAHPSAAKAGVDALSNVLAVELGPRGIRSNVIAPGPIGETEGMLRLMPKSLSGDSLETEIPVQRMGTIKDIADATVFLFSPAASFITGHILVVDGGSWHRLQLMGRIPYPMCVLEPEKLIMDAVGKKADKSKL